ncbi:MAG TPA: nitronate monooxygenase [Eubacteriaceae bacterium]|jgi:nitronate monooxygenase|nr:nitronate monooxygenase [Eubacteriaceae bacterium]
MKLNIKNKTAEYPIIQGGMGVGISLGILSGAVAREGAMGTISMVNIGYREDDFYTNALEANIRGFKTEFALGRKIAKGKGLIGVNIMVAANQYEELVKEAVKEKVDYIISGAGLPLNLPKLVEDEEILISPIVSSLKALKLINKVWLKKYNRLPDFVVLEGSGAGGHLGFKKEEIEKGKSLEKLTREILKYLKAIKNQEGKDIPLFVAGSVYDGYDLKKYRELGATGIQIGTRFIGTYECDADIKYKEFIIASKEKDLTIIDSPAGLPGRIIRNNLLEKIKKSRIPSNRCINCLRTCDPKNTPFCISDALINSVKGNIDNGLIFAGSKLDKITEIVTVKSIIKEIIKEYSEK